MFTLLATVYFVGFQIQRLRFLLALKLKVNPSGIGPTLPARRASDVDLKIPISFISAGMSLASVK